MFKAHLRDPEVIETIPVVKTPIIAAHAMDVIHTAVQGGIENPDEVDNTEMPDISEYVIFFHEDLRTGEQLQAAQQCCLFHLKMTCADAIWWTFLHPSAAWEDDMSLMQDVGVLRPQETGIYASKPGFWRMHQLIRYAAIWTWNWEYTSLEAFALSEPSFEEL
ncbi:hypothetical protein BS17DRAFT_796475 [Gyrodon lividus]|nr:hypothetical protein BS17DRAFT_796475 [Gyrodon lividus]